jgi:hypothetical protein
VEDKTLLSEGKGNPNKIIIKNLRQAATQARSNVISAQKCLEDTGTGTFLGRILFKIR